MSSRVNAVNGENLQDPLNQKSWLRQWLPCNLSLMSCFADINVSQGYVATYARCGGIFNMRLTANLPRHLPVKICKFATYARCGGIFNMRLTANLPRHLPVKICKSVKIWQNYGHEYLAHFFGPPCRLNDRYCSSDSDEFELKERSALSTQVAIYDWL